MNEPRGRRKNNSPWKHTERDRGWMRRKARADARAATHTFDPERRKEGCAAR